MIEKCNVIEAKLTLLAKKKSIAEIKKDDAFSSLLNEEADHLSFFVKRLSYKLLILSCYWPITYKHDEDNYEPENIAYPQDISDYINREDESYLTRLYNEWKIDGVDRGGLIEAYIKIITVIADRKIDFPVIPVSSWADYLEGVFKDRALEYIYATPYDGVPPVEGLAKLLNATKKCKPEVNIPCAVIEKIGRSVERILSTSHNNSLGIDWKLINSVHTIFGLGSDKYLLNNRNWTQVVINFINSQPNKAEWEKLLFHFGKASAPKPAKKWLTDLDALISNIEQQEIISLYAKTIEALLEEIPIEFPFSSDYNLNVMRGLIFCIEHLNPKSVSTETLKLAEYCFQKIPDLGTHLPSLAKICITVLGKANDDASVYGLHKLRGDYQNKSIKVNKRLLKDIAFSIEKLSKARGNTTADLKKLANTINNGKSDIKASKQPRTPLNDEQTLKEIKRLGLDFIHRKTAINNDYSSPGYRLDGDNVTELYIWTVKPKEVWKLLGGLQNLIKVKYDLEWKHKTVHREIINLKKLRVLDVSNQKLAKLSNNLFRMQSLETLNASSNEIESIDQRISENTVLQSLDLGGNKLTEIPDEMVNLNALKILYLTSNQLTAIPKISQSIKKLNIDDNRISEISSSIIDLVNLETLNLSDNPIKEIPEYFSSLDNLRVLNIRETKIRELPAFLAKLKNIKRIFTDIENYDKSLWREHNGSLIPVREIVAS
jgi:Leucine-rich repeat (LRR) protein